MTTTNYSHYEPDNIRTREVRAVAASRAARIDRAKEALKELQRAASFYASHATPERLQDLQDAAKAYAPVKGWESADDGQVTR